MPNRERISPVRSAAFLLAVFSAILFTASAAPCEEATVAKQATVVIDIFGHGPVEFTWVKGSCDLSWTPPYPDPFGHIVIETEIISLDLRGADIEIGRNPDVSSIGSSRSLSPGIDFPAESFFDVYFEIELPGFFPMDTLINYAPLHLTGIIEQYPPYYAVYTYPMGEPPIILFNRAGIDVAAILSWEERVLPWYPPEADVFVETAYKSYVALFNEDGLIEARASLNGIDDSEITHAEFGIRPAGEPVPFTTFYTDYSGEGTRASTTGPVGEGDGWCGYFDPGSEPFEEHVYEIRVEFFTPRWGPRIDTCSVWIDGTPPIPRFLPLDEPDTTRLYQIDSFFDITYTMDDELPAPCPAELQAFPLSQRFERALTVVDQLGLGTPLDSVSCGPAAAASCLKYFVDNGFPGLDNPGGDEAKPDASAEDIARELQGSMGTTEKDGTSEAGMVSGIRSYLDGHGATGWDVSSHSVDDAAGLGEMFRELEADGEDVIVLLQDTLTSGEGAGDTTGHWVTLGSREQIQHSPDSTSQKIDFMDPWGGGSTADNNYDVGEDENGNPTTEGYDLDGGGSDAKIVGYVKVSPPEVGGGGSIPDRPAFDPGWIPIDAGMVRGNGLTDTLHWNTSGFMPGLYLLEVVTTNHQGHTCRDLALCLLVEPVTGDDPETPGVKTGLLGTYPNPFNPMTTIAYSIAKDGPITIAIYDIAGRRIRLLLDGKTVEAGNHTITWDGLDDGGGRVSSGVYFCRFSAGDVESSAKVILLR